MSRQEIIFHNFSHGGYKKQNETFGPCFWAYFNLIAVHSGSLIYQFPDLQKTVTVKEGELLLIYPDTLYSGSCETETAFASVCRFDLDSSLRQVEPWRSYINQAHHFMQFPKADKSFLSLINHSVFIAREASDELNYVKCSSLLTYLMTELLPTRFNSPKRRGRIHHQAFIDLIFWLRDNLSKEITVKEMGERCGISESHFRAEFQAFSGWAPKVFFTRLKMQTACTRLRYTTTSVKEIAFDLGFKEVSSFYKAFRQYSKLTPAKFRKQGFELAVQHRE